MTRALLERLGRSAEVSVVAFSVSWHGRGRLPELVPAGVEAAGRPMAARPLRWAWGHGDWPPIELWTGPADVVHGPNFVVPPARRAARVVTVHDLTAVHHPELCTADVLHYPALLRRAVAAGAWVQVPSTAVAAEVMEYVGTAAERVVVVANGVDEVPAAPLGAGRARAGRERYVLALGTLEPRKDLPTLVAAFEQLAHDDPDIGLVLAGADGWGAEAVHTAVANSRHRDRIRLTGWVDGQARAALLRDATVLAYPSLYEGFGLPPLEAMGVGVPVVSHQGGVDPRSRGRRRRPGGPRGPRRAGRRAGPGPHRRRPPSRARASGAGAGEPLFLGRLRRRHDRRLSAGGEFARRRSVDSRRCEPWSPVQPASSAAIS